MVFNEFGFSFKDTISSPTSISSYSLYTALSLSFILPSLSPSHTFFSPLQNLESPSPHQNVISPFLIESSFDSPSLPVPAPPPPPCYPTRLRHPKEHTDGTILWPPPHSHAIMVALIPFAPTSVIEAFKFTDWRQAMQLEFNALLDTHTWTLVPPFASQNLVGCK